MEGEKTRLLIARESGKVKEKGNQPNNDSENEETETEKVIMKIRAETAAAVAQIEMQEQIILKEGKQKLQEIESRHQI